MRARVRKAAVVTTAGTIAILSVAACGLDILGTAGPAIDAGDAGEDAQPESDAGASPALPLVDAGSSPDAATVLDAAPAPGFCASQTTPFVYCNDFENAVVGFPNERSTGGAIAVEPFGANHALKVNVDQGSAARSVYVSQPLASLGQLTATGYDITFSFSVRSSSLAYAVLGGPFLASGPGVTGGYAMGAAAYDDGFRLDFAQPTPDILSVYWLPGDTWHSAWIRYGRAPVGSPFVQLVVDGVFVALDRVQKNDLPTLDLRLGVYATSEDDGAAEVLYDDVLVRTF